MISVCIATFLVVAVVTSAADSGCCQGRAVDNLGPCVNPWGTADKRFGAAFCNAPNRDFVDLTANVSGTVPAWLSGTLFRNVPSLYNFGPDEVQHWFDGFAQINAIHFNGSATAAGTQQVWMRAKLADTRSSKDMCGKCRYDETGAYTYPYPGSIAHPNTSARSMPSAAKVLNNDVSLLQIGGRFVMTTDDSAYVEFDPDTLDVLTPNGNGVVFNDTFSKMKATVAVTHGAMDVGTNEWFNVENSILPTAFGLNATIHFTRLNGTHLAATGEWVREGFAQVQTRYAAYAHSMTVSGRYALFVENQVALSAFEIGLLGIPAMRAMYVPDSKYLARMHLADRTTGAVRTVEIPGFDKETRTKFGWVIHTGNAFEDPIDGSTVYDAAVNPDPLSYNVFTMESILNATNWGDLVPIDPSNRSGFARCRVYPWATEAECSVIAPNRNFPQYNKVYHTIKHQWTYLTELGTADTADMGGNVTKLNMHTNQTDAVFHATGTLLTEALFIARHRTPSKTNQVIEEDDGVVLTLGFDLATKLGVLFGLDAKTMRPMFEVRLPFAVPLHFHGIFCASPPEDGARRKARPPSSGAGEDQRYCVWN